MNRSENEIIEKMRQNPNVGMKLLMDAYQERLYWHVRRLVVSHDDAQDLLQESFLKIYRSFSSFKGNSSLFSWIYRITTNVVLSSLRSQKQVTAPLDDVRGVKGDTYFEFGDAEAVALQKAIHSLPPKQQAVFNMRYYDEMSFKEIAEVNDCSENSAKANYHFAKNKIIELMKQCVFDGV